MEVDIDLGEINHPTWNCWTLAPTVTGKMSGLERLLSPAAGDKLGATSLAIYVGWLSGGRAAVAGPFTAGPLLRVANISQLCTPALATQMSSRSGWKAILGFMTFP